jgi:hypothetical protein
MSQKIKIKRSEVSKIEQLEFDKLVEAALIANPAAVLQTEGTDVAAGMTVNTSGNPMVIEGHSEPDA